MLPVLPYPFCAQPTTNVEIGLKAPTLACLFGAVCKTQTQ